MNSPILAVLLLGSTAVFADAGVSIDNDSSVWLKMRTRYGFVDDGDDKKNDSVDLKIQETENANAVTNRFILHGEFKLSSNFEVVAEGNHVTAFQQDYNSTEPGAGLDPDHAIETDPPITRAVEGYLKYHRDHYHLAIGRKRLTFDDQRFVGSRDWRQTPQSFGVVEVGYRTDSLYLLFDYAYEILSITDRFNKKWSEGSGFINLGYQRDNFDALLFGYLIQDVHDTYGVRLAYGKPILQGRLRYAIQRDPTATQKKAATDNDRKSSFYEITLDGSLAGVLYSAGYAVFGKAEDDADQYGFSTPIAALHRFDGFSDVVNSKKASGDPLGLETYNVGLGYKHDLVGVFKLWYHNFSSQQDHLDYGSEWNALYQYSISPSCGFSMKYAHYVAGEDFNGENAENLSQQKFWIQGEFKI